MLMICSLSLSACAGQLGSGAPQSEYLAQGFGPQDSALFACFDADMAARLGAEVERGAPRPWARAQFRYGFCLALPAATRIIRKEPHHSDGHSLTKIQVEGSKVWMYLPSWGSTLTVRAGDQTTRDAFARLVPTSQQLLVYADRHMHCLEEVIVLNARVAAHNQAFELHKKVTHHAGGGTLKRAEDSLPISVLIFSLSPIELQGKRLQKEVHEYRTRCMPYQTLEGSEDFIEFVRDRSGVKVPLATLLASLPGDA